MDVLRTAVSPAKTITVTQEIKDMQLNMLEEQESVIVVERMSLLIQETSNCGKGEADRLAKLVDSITTDYKKKYGFRKDNARVLAIISTESDFRNLSPNSCRATGYMQVTPVCLRAVNKQLSTDYSDLSDTETNLRVGIYYLYKDIQDIGEDKAIVAYNQGKSRLDSAVRYSRGISNSYLNKVDRRYQYYKERL